MQILAIDTASPQPAVALFSDGKVFEEPLPSDRRSSEELLPAVTRVLAAAATRLEECDRVAVCSGPGSFTGARIGLATAWGLGRAAGIPVEAVSTLECMAEAARPSGFPRLLAVLDAGRGELMVERFALSEPRARSLAPAARVSARELSVRGGAEGEGMVELPPGLTGAAAVGLASRPASALALAVARSPRALDGGPIRASYSRPSAAEEKLGAS